MRKQYSPIIEIYESARVLREMGFDNRSINSFILESCSGLQEEANLLLEEKPNLSQFLQGEIEGVFDAFLSTGKKKLAGIVLSLIGLEDGLLKKSLMRAIQTIGMDDIKAYTTGDSNEICAQILTNVTQVAGGTVLDHLVDGVSIDKETGQKSKLGLSSDGWLYNIMSEAIMPSNSNRGLTGILKQKLNSSVCPAITSQFDNMSPVASSKDDENKEPGWMDKFMKKFGDSYDKGYKPWDKAPASIGSVSENFQKKMKRRLAKQMKKLLDGGRKDLVKYGKPWNQKRQKYSNAFAEGQNYEI